MQGIEVPIKDVCPCSISGELKLIIADICWKNTIRIKEKPTITISRPQHRIASRGGSGIFAAATTTTGNSRCGPYAQRETYGKCTRSFCEA
jgi:hypothetical protein